MAVVLGDASLALRGEVGNRERYNLGWCIARIGVRIQRYSLELDQEEAVRGSSEKKSRGSLSAAHGVLVGTALVGVLTVGVAGFTGVKALESKSAKQYYSAPQQIQPGPVAPPVEPTTPAPQTVTPEEGGMSPSKPSRSARDSEPVELPLTVYGTIDWSKTKCSGDVRRLVWGDTLSQIAVDGDSSVKGLASLNKVANPDLIYADSLLCVR